MSRIVEPAFVGAAALIGPVVAEPVPVIDFRQDDVTRRALESAISFCEGALPEVISAAGMAPLAARTASSTRKKTSRAKRRRRRQQRRVARTQHRGNKATRRLTATHITAGRAHPCQSREVASRSSPFAQTPFLTLLPPRCRVDWPSS
jgi:hypothetical protein